MMFDKRTCRQAILLLTGLSVTIAFSSSQPASQSANDSSSLKNLTTNFLSSLPSVAFLKHGHMMAQLGGYWGISGEQQHINIHTLIGNTYTVTKREDSNVLAGLGYYVAGQEKRYFSMSYGINWFYLAKTAVAGLVIQENLFTNLSYGYHLTHYPVYAMAKSTIKMPSDQYAVTLDAGIGPNFMRASGFYEAPINPASQADAPFPSRTNTTFSATVGAGLKLNHAFGNVPLECGYRFFYLGQGRFNSISNQLNNFNTGATYANAIVCGITL
jgi:hypothetical protein